MATEKILVVDDDTNICELLRLYLEKEGYSVTIANTGMQAVKLFAEHQPDLMLLDIMLPELDGWQVCREIRKYSNKPIIMLTAKGETLIKFLALSSVPMITSPSRLRLKRFLQESKRFFAERRTLPLPKPRTISSRFPTTIFQSISPIMN